MSAVRKLQNIQQKNNSIVCLGLDLDPKRMPSEFTGSIKTMFDYTHRIIDATSDLVCAYKPNMAFYESLGTEGWSLLRLIIERIPDDIPVIVDGKRGDIGNTAGHYARCLFEQLHADWVTLNPYMGYDSMRPFLEYKECGVFVLCLTSNTGAKDFQQLKIDGKPLYGIVAEKVAYWNKDHNCGLVVGATHPEQLRDIRVLAGDMPLLIPGVGAQGGSLEQAAELGTDDFRKIAVINVSRSVLYASAESDFAQKAREQLMNLNNIVNSLRLPEKTAGGDQPQQGQDSEAARDDQEGGGS
jgi:orotidine-5'-phosphate decarboxylase